MRSTRWWSPASVFLVGVLACSATHCWVQWTCSLWIRSWWINRASTGRVGSCHGSGPPFGSAPSLGPVILDRPPKNVEAPSLNQYEVVQRPSNGSSSSVTNRKGVDRACTIHPFRIQLVAVRRFKRRTAVVKRLAPGHRSAASHLCDQDRADPDQRNGGTDQRDHVDTRLRKVR